MMNSGRQEDFLQPWRKSISPKVLQRLFWSFWSFDRLNQTITHLGDSSLQPDPTQQKDEICLVTKNTGAANVPAVVLQRFLFQTCRSPADVSAADLQESLAPAKPDSLVKPVSFMSPCLPTLSPHWAQTPVRSRAFSHGQSPGFRSPTNFLQQLCSFRVFVLFSCSEGSVRTSQHHASSPQSSQTYQTLLTKFWI